MDTGEQFYMENDPALMDPNSAEFEALMNGSDSDGEGKPADDAAATAKQDEEGASSGAAGEQNSENTQDDSQTKVAGVLSPDGKHVIPYGALKQARQEATEARRAAEEANAQLEALRAQLSAKPGDEIDVDVDATQADTKAITAKLKQLGDDFPEFGEVATAMMAQLEAMQTKVNELEAERQQQHHERAKTVQERVAEAIDSNPSLSLWKAEQPDAFEQAVEFDKMLRKQPEWQGKPMSERFAKVVDLVRVAYPEAKRPQPVASTKENKQNLDAKVDEALEKAGDYVPESLSHIPGGEAPSANDGKFQSVTDLEAFMEKATPDQIDAYLAKFG